LAFSYFRTLRTDMTEQNRKWSESPIHDQVKQAGLDNAGEAQALPSSSGSVPEVLESSARKWSDDGENREACAFLLSSGEWVLTWVSGEGEGKRQTTVKLSPTAALATMSAIYTVSEKTGKPLGWIPEQKTEDSRAEGVG
jgi:glycerate-2-kinase